MIGQSRHPSVDDRADLPYTNAVLHEIQRMANIVPFSAPHFTNKEIQLGGYKIPKVISGLQFYVTSTAILCLHELSL